MRYLIFALLISFNAYAVSDIEETRNHISGYLNNIVKELKSQFKPLEDSLKDNFEDTKTLEEDVDLLVEKSEEKETNPTLLKHGKKSLKDNCDYNSQNLNWTGSEWKCLPANILADCNAANDEYRVQKSDGSYVCQKTPSGGNVNAYWKYLGHSIQCNSSNGQYSNIYGCFYKNKLNQEVQIANSECSGKSKPYASTKTCTSSWIIGDWGNCSESCGGGTQYRSITCPSGKVCLGTKPVTSQACNTQACALKVANWVTGSWSSCSATCNGSQRRSVTCPSGYTCPGAKPSAVQSCNTDCGIAQPQETSWVTSSWSSCSKSCGGGSQTRSVTCPSGYVCPGAKPTTSQVCNTQACTASWKVGSWSSCSKSCGGGTQTRSVTCPSGFSCTGAKPSTSQSCNTSACLTWKDDGQEYKSCVNPYNFPSKKLSSSDLGRSCSSKGQREVYFVTSAGYCSYNTNGTGPTNLIVKYARCK